MNRTNYSPEFREQALRRVRERGSLTLSSVAAELNVSLGTLTGGIGDRGAASWVLPLGENPLPQGNAAAWSAAQRLQALNESHALSGDALHVWCREKGLFAHQLQAWRHAFCELAEPASHALRAERAALRELQTKHDGLARQLLRKDKALAEAAALLVLQKKFQALWVDEAP